MRFDVLGPLRIEDASGAAIEVRAPMVGRLLAVLLCHAGEAVSMETLIDALWPEDPPERAEKTVQLYVTRLRKVLGEPDRVPRRGAGYILRVDDGELDATRFVDLVRNAAHQRESGRLEDAERSLNDALELWRGTPYSESAECSAVQPTIQRLVEWRVRALEDWADVALARGRHADLAPELAGLLAEFPYRERLAGRLMIALYRCDRQADALEVFRETRARLDADLGVEPGAELQKLHEQMLRCDPALDVPPPAAETTRLASRRTGSEPGPPIAEPAGSAPIVPAQLPPDLSSLTGRDGDLTDLLGLAIEHPDTHGTLVVSAIDGMAGVGKTVLAVRAAHRMADRYPDGQLFLDLHGFTRGMEPVEPITALDRLLRSVGVRADRIPPELEERSALWRSTCVGKRLLILLDNAASESQVGPLLPAEPGCLVLVTSRRRMSGLDDALPVSLDVLTPDSAAGLFRQVTGAARIDGDGDPAELVTQIVELCGRLPLAIRLAASRFRARPTWRLSDLLTRLRDERHRLDELEAGERSVAGAFALSYKQSGAEQQRMFRLLGLYPGTDVDPFAAAALADVDRYKAERLLEELVDLHLIQPRSYGRYGFHDLLRAHAVATCDRAESDDTRRAAMTRIGDYYLRSASLAMDAVEPTEKSRRPVVEPIPHEVPELSDPQRASAWLDRERSTMMRLARESRADRPGWILDLARCLQRHLVTGLHYADMLSLNRAQLEEARRVGDTAAEARGLGYLAVALHWTGRPAESVDHFERAIERAEVCGDLQLLATCRANLGRVLKALGRLDEALGHFDWAAEAFRQSGNGTQEAIVLEGKASTLSTLGRYEEAQQAATRAVGLNRDAGNALQLAHATLQLGLAEGGLGRGDQAVAHLGEAVTRCRAVGADHSIALAAQGMALAGLGRFEEAIDRCEEALGSALARDDANTEYEARQALAEVRAKAGDPAAAVAHAERAVDLAGGLGSVPDEARALEVLGKIYQRLGRSDEARRSWSRAIELYRTFRVSRAEKLESELAREGAP